MVGCSALGNMKKRKINKMLFVGLISFSLVSCGGGGGGGGGRGKSSSDDDGGKVSGEDTVATTLGTAPDSLKGYVLQCNTVSRKLRYYLSGDSTVYVKASFYNHATGYHSGEQRIFGTIVYRPSKDRKTAEIYISTPSEWVGTTVAIGGSTNGFQFPGSELVGTLYFDSKGDISRIEGKLDYNALSSDSRGVMVPQ